MNYKVNDAQIVPIYSHLTQAWPKLASTVSRQIPDFSLKYVFIHSNFIV